MLLAFLTQGPFLRWFDHTVVNALVGAVLGIVLIGWIVAPTLQRWKRAVVREWQEHKQLLAARVQLCPVCAGQGQVTSEFYSRDWYAGKRPQSSVTVECRTCAGKGVLPPWGET